MNILFILAAISVAVYGETCNRSNNNQYSDKIEVCGSSGACNYTYWFANKSHILGGLVLPHENDTNYKLKADVSLNLT